MYGLSRESLGGLALAAVGGSLLYRGLSGHCSLYAALGVSTTAHHGSATSVPAGEGYRVEVSLLVHRPAAELFHLWRNFENLPRFMNHLESVTPLEANRSRWVARGPLGKHVEWEAETINVRENELIAWRSREGSDVDTAGSVHFTPSEGGRSTVLHVSLKYAPPAGKLGAAVASLLGASPERQIREDLYRFKHRVEAGEMARFRA